MPHSPLGICRDPAGMLEKILYLPAVGRRKPQLVPGLNKMAQQCKDCTINSECYPYTKTFRRSP